MATALADVLRCSAKLPWWPEFLLPFCGCRAVCPPWPLTPDINHSLFEIILCKIQVIGCDVLKTDEQFVIVLHQQPCSPKSLQSSSFCARRLALTFKQVASTASAVLNVLTCCLCDWTIYPVKECIMWKKLQTKPTFEMLQFFCFVCCQATGESRAAAYCRCVK